MVIVMSTLVIILVVIFPRLRRRTENDTLARKEVGFSPAEITGEHYRALAGAGMSPPPGGDRGAPKLAKVK